MINEEFIHAMAIRALRTFAQSMLAYIGTSAVIMSDVNWLGALSAGVLGACLSALMALAGLPEVE